MPDRRRITVPFALHIILTVGTSTQYHINTHHLTPISSSAHIVTQEKQLKAPLTITNKTSLPNLLKLSKISCSYKCYIVNHIV